MKWFLNNRLLLFYPAGFAETGRLQEIADRQRAEFRLVEASQLGAPLAVLAGLLYDGAVQADEPDEFLPRSTLVFSGFTEERLNRALAEIREAGLCIDLKAVITPENETWSFARLIRELDREKQRISEAAK